MFEWSPNFVCNTQETQTQKRWTRILKFEFCDFENFFKFSKRRRAAPLRPIWTIVAAKLDHSRVLVTKFRKNRSTLKGKVPVRDTHTDRQTDKPVGFYGPTAPPEFRMPAVRNAPDLRSQRDAAPPVQSEYPADRRAAAAVPLPESP